MLVVAKRFGAAGARGREAGARNPVLKAILYSRSPDKLVQETSIEAVAGADGIDRLNRKSSHAKATAAVPSNHALCTTLDDHDGNDA